MNLLRCPSEWKTVPLRSVTAPNEGVQTGPFGSQLHREDYVEEGTPMITVEHIGNNKILHTRAPCISDQDRERLKKFWLDIGDIVFSRVGSVDRRAIVREAEKGWLFSGSCLRVRVDQSKIEPLYLSYYLGHPLIKDHFRSIALGSTRPSINTTILSDLPISFPASLSEQKAIASILGALDDKIEVNQKMNRILEEIVRAIFKSWFVDFDPVRARVEGRPTGLPSDISDLFPDELVESELGQIPKGWEMRPLSKLVKEVGVKIKPSEQTENIPYVPIECISSKSLTLYGAKDGSEAKSSLVSFRKEDILFGAMRPYFHKVCVAPFNGTTRTTCLVLNTVSPEMYGFSLFTLSDEKTVEFATQNSTGSTIPYIKWKNGLETMLVATPNIAVAKKFTDLVGPIVEKFCLAIKTEKVLTSLRDTLLPKLISGEVRVPDAEKFLEETVS